MSTEKKLRAAPLEVPEKRPDLYVMGNEWPDGTTTLSSSGVWLVKRGGKVAIRASVECPVVPVGGYRPGAPWGPKYTGPIDDEMMANILIYGGG